jgi:hypothetical protein
MEIPMAATPGSLITPTTRILPRWAAPAAALALAAMWAVVFEGGVVSNAVSDTGSFLHELFHDGRHLLGAPCH